MKILISLLLFIACLVFSGCSTVGENPALEGSTWRLTDTKISSGGPVVYTPTDREEVISFLSNNKVRNSNGWCGEGNPGTTGYSEGIIYTDCNSNSSLIFEIDGNSMILRNPRCIESCDLKYLRIKN